MTVYSVNSEVIINRKPSWPKCLQAFRLQLLPFLSKLKIRAEVCDQRLEIQRCIDTLS